MVVFYFLLEKHLISFTTLLLLITNEMQSVLKQFFIQQCLINVKHKCYHPQHHFTLKNNFRWTALLHTFIFVEQVSLTTCVLSFMLKGFYTPLSLPNRRRAFSNASVGHPSLHLSIRLSVCPVILLEGTWHVMDKCR